MTYQVMKTADLMPWILSWGSGAEVMAPPELRDSMRREAEKVANMLT